MFARGSTEKLESFIGSQSEFKGGVTVKGTLRVEGLIHGQVSADYVVLSEKATIRGNITAKKIIVDGKVEGNLRAEENVEIKSRGEVWGDIFSPKFSLAAGGKFNGKIQMKMDESKVVDFNSNSQEI